ncbi:(+)-borneol dehydrogenase 1-like [Magnolia sinica]|uniref:(+)-borneol dehydrogenase 1-like n=1 Tax=Magnolia sinica TaxID=86752 RepID=UPI002658B2AB|nr:(+)-borneol dehydrogenase 1-like [Magnolia sinica]
MNTTAPTLSSKRLEGKVAIITGAASGIGESTARLFWAHGAKVVIADVQDDLGRAICQDLDDNAMYVHCDVTNEDDMRDLVDLTIEKYGKLDIMYNNAGVADNTAKSILTIEKSKLERVLSVNLVGGFLGTKHAARVMVPARKGCILFTGSATASIACTTNHSYVASKSGLTGLAQNVSAELGQFGIRVNCISPYAVATNMVKGLLPGGSTEQLEAFLSNAGNLKGAVLRADDVARAALFLASDDAGYVSGLNLVVDGGFSVANPSVAMALKQSH